MIPNKTDTVIFDLDGTLVDSQPAALGATIEALSQFGVQVTAAELREVFGGGARKLMGHFLERETGPCRGVGLSGNPMNYAAFHIYLGLERTQLGAPFSAPFRVPF